MATATMELKIKEVKSTKNRKVTESMDLIIPVTNTATYPISSTNEPHLETKAKKKRKSPGISEEDPPPQNGSLGSLSKKRKLSIEEIEVDISKPEPPSKKALRRLKKGKSLPPSKNGTDIDPEPEGGEEENEGGKSKKPDVEKRSEHGVWIGNLPWSITKEDLRTFLTANSDIVDDTITRIHMPSPDDGKPSNKIEESKPWKKQYNKGFAYVDFAVPEAVPQAVELSEQLLSGRRVLIKDNKSFEGRPQKTKEESRNAGKAPNKRIFLGNLRFDTTEDSLKEHFEKCGSIENIMIATFEDSGKCKGYAWVTFAELQAAESAVRGYVLVPQEDEDLASDPEQADEEARSSSDEDADDGEDKAERAEPDDNHERRADKSRPKKPAVRKAWVDKIHGRPVRREFAEDAQVRYKKRYGKDGTKNKEGGATATAQTEGRGVETPMNGMVQGGMGAKEVRPSKRIEYRTSYAPRLTGGIVESKGKKVVF